jgi:hypothetical protein
LSQEQKNSALIQLKSGTSTCIVIKLLEVSLGFVLWLSCQVDRELVKLKGRVEFHSSTEEIGMTLLLVVDFTQHLQRQSNFEERHVIFL